MAVGMRSGPFIRILVVCCCIWFLVAVSRNEDAAEVAEDDGLVPVMDDGADHLMWFVQVSDTHISIYEDPQRIKDLHEFCSYTIPAIKPSVVLCTGDLTDAKEKLMGSLQIEQEWRYYDQIIQESGVLNHTVWLDIRGNHDNFNVNDRNSSDNYFKKYSVQGKKHLRSYSYEVTKNEDRYAFIGVDFCVEPGVKRPFNFIGHLTHDDYRNVQQLINDSQDANVTLFFGHYPTSSVWSAGPGIRELLRHGVAYFCGHFHTWMGLAPQIYFLQDEGYLELELADWRQHRKYRVVAVDNGILSFVDVVHRQWPVILITNPKHALFVNNMKEPVWKMAKSSHVRVLVFALDPIKEVKLRLNDRPWLPMTHIDGPLYAAPWNPQDFIHGLHTIHVYAKTSTGEESMVEQPFSFEKKRQLSFWLSSKILLSYHLAPMFEGTLIALTVILLLPLVVIRVLHSLVKNGKINRPRCPFRCFDRILRRFWLVSTVDGVFYPFFLMTLYLPLGPWFVGRMVSDSLGVVFAWGIITRGTFLPGGFTFAYGIIHIFITNLPLMFLILLISDSKYKECYNNRPALQKSVFLRVTKIALANIPFAFLFICNIYSIYMLYFAYGIVSCIVNPLKVGSLVAATFATYRVNTLNEKDLRHIVSIFPLARRRVEEERILLNLGNGESVPQEVVQ